MSERETDRGRERERERERDRQTDRQTDRQRQRQRETQTQRERGGGELGEEGRGNTQCKTRKETKAQRWVARVQLKVGGKQMNKTRNTPDTTKRVNTTYIVGKSLEAVVSPM